MSDSNLRLFSKSEAAKLLGIGRVKLGKLLSSGRIGFIKIEERIHIPFTEIVDFIKNNTVRLNESIGANKLDSKGKAGKSIDSVSLFNKLL